MGRGAAEATPLVLTPESSPDAATSRAIEAGLDAYNDAIAPYDNLTPLWIVGRDGVGAVQAGLRAVTVYDWLFVQRLWVAAPYRRQGIGSRLLLGAEAIARERQCSACYLDTLSSQAPGFYQRHGYREFGRLNGFPPGHARIWFSKALDGPSP
jgi:GNAT superfamily N-acetyltransferase